MQKEVQCLLHQIKLIKEIIALLGKSIVAMSSFDRFFIKKKPCPQAIRDKTCIWPGTIWDQLGRSENLVWRQKKKNQQQQSA